ncbi:MAG: hypothetical protein P8Z00_06885 [Anaerolineales bacterium]|jgi:hypothetical protein
MSLRYYTPQGLSHPYIRSFSILEESQAVFNRRIILPDSYPELIINLGSHLFGELGNGTNIKLPRAFLMWTQTCPLKIHASGSCHVVGLNLNAWGLRHLVDEQIDLSKTPIIPLDDIWQSLPHLLEATIRSRGDMETLATLEQFVSDYSPRAHMDATIHEVVERLDYHDDRFMHGRVGREGKLRYHSLPGNHDLCSWRGIHQPHDSRSDHPGNRRAVSRQSAGWEPIGAIPGKYG